MLTECEWPRARGAARPRVGRRLHRGSGRLPSASSLQRTRLGRRRAERGERASGRAGELGERPAFPGRAGAGLAGEDPRGVARRPVVPGWARRPAGGPAGGARGAGSGAGRARAALHARAFRNAGWPGGTALAFALISEMGERRTSERKREREGNYTPLKLARCTLVRKLEVIFT